MHQDNFEGNKEFVLYCKKNKLFLATYIHKKRYYCILMILFAEIVNTTPSRI